MKKNGRLLLLLIGLLLAAAGPAAVSLAAEEKGDETGDETGDEDYKPYGEEEFAGWMKDLRRAEIVAAGSFPFSYILTGLSYDLYNYFDTDRNPLYLPGPFGEGEKPAYSREELMNMVYVSLSISAVIAAADYILGRFEEESGGER